MTEPDLIDSRGRRWIPVPGGYRSEDRGPVRSRERIERRNGPVRELPRPRPPSGGGAGSQGSPWHGQAIADVAWRRVRAILADAGTPVPYGQPVPDHLKSVLRAHVDQAAELERSRKALDHLATLETVAESVIEVTAYTCRCLLCGWVALDSPSPRASWLEGARHLREGQHKAGAGRDLTASADRRRADVHQERADRLAIWLMRLRDEVIEMVAEDRRVENGPTEPDDPADHCPAGDPGCDAPDDGEWHCHDACETPSPEPACTRIDEPDWGPKPAHKPDDEQHLPWSMTEDARVIGADGWQVAQCDGQATAASIVLAANRSPGNRINGALVAAAVRAALPDRMAPVERQRIAEQALRTLDGVDGVTVLRDGEEA